MKQILHNHKSPKATLLAWLLLLVFVPQMVVKSLHYHADGGAQCSHACSHDPEDQSSESDRDACAICDFVLSASTEPEVDQVVFVAEVSLTKYLISAELEVYMPLVCPSLRAPPVV